MLEKLIPMITEIRCQPDELLTLEQKADDCAIYFVEKGSVELYFEKIKVKSAN